MEFQVPSWGIYRPVNRRMGSYSSRSRLSSTRAETAFTRFGFLDKEVSLLTENYLSPIGPRTVTCVYNCGLRLSMLFVEELVNMGLAEEFQHLHYRGCVVEALCSVKESKEDSGCDDGLCTDLPTCIVCLERSVGVVFGNCGHANICIRCLDLLYRSKGRSMNCPSCRTPLTTRVDSPYSTFTTDSSCSRPPNGVINLRIELATQRCVLCRKKSSRVPGKLCTNQMCRSRTLVCRDCINRGIRDVTSCSSCGCKDSVATIYM